MNKIVISNDYYHLLQCKFSYACIHILHDYFFYIFNFLMYLIKYNFDFKIREYINLLKEILVFIVVFNFVTKYVNLLPSLSNE